MARTTRRRSARPRSRPAAGRAAAACSGATASTACSCCEPCRQVHTFGMRFPIDVAFCAADGRVLRVVADDGPGRVSRVVWRARFVLEARSRRCSAAGACIPATSSVDRASAASGRVQHRERGRRSGAGGDADRQPRRPVAARGRGAARRRRDRGRGHPADPGAAHATRASAPAAGSVAVHAHNERARGAELVDRDPWRRDGRVTSPTPGCRASPTPASELVRACVDAGLAVEVVPGPSAALTALVLSGFPTGALRVRGVPAPEGREPRATGSTSLASEARTVVLLRGARPGRRDARRPRRGLRPDRLVAVARELTKLHEEVWRGTLADAVAPRRTDRAARRARDRARGAAAEVPERDPTTPSSTPRSTRRWPPARRPATPRPTSPAASACRAAPRRRSRRSADACRAPERMREE